MRSTAEGATEEASDRPSKSKARAIERRARKGTNVSYNLKCIGNHPLFKERNSRFVQLLAGEMDIRIYCPGELILREGEVGESAYVLHHGTVDVLAGERQRKVATLGAGTLFGEMILLGVSRKRTATVRAVEFCDCRIIARELFLGVLRFFPKEFRFFKCLAMSRLRSLAAQQRARSKSVCAPVGPPPQGGGGLLPRSSLADVANQRRRTLSPQHRSLQRKRHTNVRTSVADIPWPHDATPMPDSRRGSVESRRDSVASSGRRGSVASRRDSVSSKLRESILGRRGSVENEERQPLHIAASADCKDDDDGGLTDESGQDSPRNRLRSRAWAATTADSHAVAAAVCGEVIASNHMAPEIPAVPAPAPAARAASASAIPVARKGAVAEMRRMVSHRDRQEDPRTERTPCARQAEPEAPTRIPVRPWTRPHSAAYERRPDPHAVNLLGRRRSTLRPGCSLRPHVPKDA
mmetsp:Transcript_55265/g.131766  ORF Transcript_55265/g.131766 Transcript_55265/m.131766 type:complete len:465 (-) Transcript_55265:260-1654(-)